MQLTGHQEKKDGYYDAIYNQGYNTRNYYPLYNEVLRMIENIPSPRILETGCGVGDLGKMIIEKGYPYRGFDFSEAAVECSQKLCPGGNFFVGDAYDPRYYTPFDYNIVVALEVLEHIDDFRMIENIPTGVTLIASVPNYDDPAHLRLYLDPQRDIIARFAPYLRINEIKAFSAPQDTASIKRTIFLFKGIRHTPASEIQTIAGDIRSPMIGRNDPCPCGSGKKYKKCCLK
jgi:2-polyprenyl-3-methyl-5-hydroxy-6-metoxy-1,4-benzoquinol methylase